MFWGELLVFCPLVAHVSFVDVMGRGGFVLTIRAWGPAGFVVWVLSRELLRVLSGLVMVVGVAGVAAAVSVNAGLVQAPACDKPVYLPFDTGHMAITPFGRRAQTAGVWGDVFSGQRGRKNP